MVESEWTVRAMAYIDGEMPEDEVRRFEAFLGAHPDIAREVRTMQAVRGLASQAMPPSPPPEYWDEFPRGVWGRIHRGLGWLFYLAGALILLAYAAYAFLTSTAAGWIKIGVLAFGLGFLLLLLSVLRQRLREARTDRYSSEVRR